MSITITHCILTCGEVETFPLIDFFKKHKDKDDKIMLLVDPAISDEYLKKLKLTNVKIVLHAVDKDYSAHRNYVLDKVHTDYLMEHDSDEQPTLDFIKDIKKILIMKDADAIVYPRMNLFTGVKPYHCKLYGWNLKHGMVNWTDHQCRLIRMRRGLKWVGKLHEAIKFDWKRHKVVHLPGQTKHAIIHRKHIDKQIKDNTRYKEGWTVEDNNGTATRNLLDEAKKT